MRPEAVSQEGGRVEATWLRPLLVSSGSHAATPHPRGRKETRKRRPRTPKTYPSVKPGQVQTTQQGRNSPMLARLEGRGEANRSGQPALRYAREERFSAAWVAHFGPPQPSGPVRQRRAA